MYVHGPTSFSNFEPSSEWHDFSYLQPAPSNRNVAISLFLILWIAVLDLCTPRTNFSILYIAPLVTFAQCGRMKSGWGIAGVLVLLTFGVHFLKDAIYPPSSNLSFWYRQVNRGIVAVMIVAMSQVLRLWVHWRDEQYDAELPESFRHQDQEISATFAVLSCVPLIAMIALTDFFSPANYNWAILYPIPLFICGWTRSRPLLWGMLILLLLLAGAGFVWGPPPSTPRVDFALQRNRILAGLGMAVVTLSLHYWLGRDQRARR